MAGLKPHARRCHRAERQGTGVRHAGQQGRHVDGAYGGAGLAAPSVRHLFAGVEHADSFIVDPHKWLFAPFDCCALIYRDPAQARAAHTQHASYLDAVNVDGEWNPSDFAIQLTRRARGLPFWFSLAVHGTDAYTVAIEQTLDVTRAGAELIRSRAARPAARRAGAQRARLRAHRLGRRPTTPAGAAGCSTSRSASSPRPARRPGLHPVRDRQPADDAPTTSSCSSTSTDVTPGAADKVGAHGRRDAEPGEPVLRRVVRRRGRHHRPRPRARPRARLRPDRPGRAARRCGCWPRPPARAASSRSAPAPGVSGLYLLGGHGAGRRAHHHRRRGRAPARGQGGVRRGRDRARRGTG